MVQTPDGGLSLTASDGTRLLSGGGAAMWDSTTTPSAPGARATEPGAQAAGVPDETVRHTDVPMRVDGGQLVLNPDQAWLADSSTVFPAYVDPQFGTGASRWAYANSDNHNNNDGYA